MVDWEIGVRRPPRHCVERVRRLRLRRGIQGDTVMKTRTMSLIALLAMRLRWHDDRARRKFRPHSRPKADDEKTLGRTHHVHTELHHQRRRLMSGFAPP